MNPITIRHTVRPRGRTLATNEVADLFGLDEGREILTVAEGLLLDIRPGDLVIFTGPSGAGKSSLLRAAGAQLGALDAQALALPDQPLIESLPGPIGQRLDRLAACGLAEARLLLRAPSELSDGQRYRFRLAYALATAEAGEGSFILADEFAALLDRTLAKTLAFNLRKLVSRSGIGVLAATTHDDLIDDLNPDLHVRCLGEGAVECLRHDPQKKKRQFRERVLALGGHPIRLAVFRSVALSQPPSRLRPASRDALARERARRDLRLRQPCRQFDPAVALLRAEESTKPGEAGRVELATLGARASRARSGLPRGGHRGRIRSPRLPDLPRAVDRDADGHGPDQSLL